MKAVIQRVKSASVTVDGTIVNKINQGLLVLLGVGKKDGEDEADVLAQKIVNLRVFADETKGLNCSILEIRGQILVVSQFTLFADCKKGRRPSFTEAATPGKAQVLYEYFVKSFKKYNVEVKSGIFAAYMHVELVNDGPVTIILDTEEL